MSNSKASSVLLLVTANVGSIFEDPENMLQLWLNEFLSEVRRLDPDFIAIHCQEVGGKNYEDSMKNVNLFVKSLLASAEMEHFDKARIFLDEDFTAADKFTALGSMYFVHESVQDVQIYNFQTKEFVPLTGKEVLSGNIEHVALKEKAKFPQEFFPNYKWSRKGFIRTRWNISQSTFDLINIHLFHDASNIVAMEASPSEYCLVRKKALDYTINRFETDEYPKVPYFIFGDFNFRLDTYKIIQDLTAKLQEHQCIGKKNELSKVTYTDGNHEKVMLTVEKKSFEHLRHDDVFYNCSQWLKSFDQELQSFSHKLQEFPVTFPPSYPFSEDVNDGRSYMKTRCPSWCDRILYTPSAKSLIVQDESPRYDMIGRNVCMGDHKPIYLNVKLRQCSGNQEDVVLRSRDLDPSDLDLPLTSDNQTVLRRHSTRRQSKVISINGEELEMDELDDLNIHDYSTFEHEQLLTGMFFDSIKRKSSLGGDFRGLSRGSVGDGSARDSVGSRGSAKVPKKPSFKHVVRDVIRIEQVIHRLYSHRSDTEEDSDMEELRKHPVAPPITRQISDKNSLSADSKDVVLLEPDDQADLENNNNNTAPPLTPSNLDSAPNNNNNYSPYPVFDSVPDKSDPDADPSKPSQPLIPPSQLSAPTDPHPQTVHDCDPHVSLKQPSDGRMMAADVVNPSAASSVHGYVENPPQEQMVSSTATPDVAPGDDDPSVSPGKRKSPISQHARARCPCCVIL